MVSHLDSKGSSYTTSTISNGTSEHTLSSHSYMEDPLGLSLLNEQLMDDLAIIDDLYDIYGQELDCPDKESVAMIARNVANKHKVLQDLYQSEIDYIHDLTHFQQHYIHFISQWLDDPIHHKIDKPSAKPLFVYQDLISIHRQFLRNLNERLKIWGPTQLVANLFANLRSMLDVYHIYFSNYSNIMMTISKLYSFTQFNKSLESHHHTGTTDQPTHDLLYYLRLPIFRIQAYTQALGLLLQFSDPSHIDFEALTSVSLSFKHLMSELQERMVDAQTHFQVLEAYRTINNCPVQVTPTRRLLLKSRMIKVDLDDLTSVADVRTYILYNDQLIFCKKDNSNKKQQQQMTLQYKGDVDLIHCDLRVLSPAVCAKMVEVKRSVLSSFRSSKKTSADNTIVPPSPAYGFELITSENSMDIMPNNSQNASSATSGAPTKRRHIIRTQSLEEQKLWVDTLKKVMQHIRWLQANNNN
ncbi:Dbl homology domain-containing protein [Halteromyces radiatus]|uniref:Dbl homology domain-containing protein n=1 Tax=Halteromyces radiatus TaxID=101107 RepID=UPI00221E7B3F|nr:Dbl homology domain-containing protein [Halteromyces radiatus]KAI8088684.1 Dbl homology domain-containing protein [Halteromyces radiatus]